MARRQACCFLTSLAPTTTSHTNVFSTICVKWGYGELVPWVEAFLTGRSTRIRLPGHLSDVFPTPTGIPQGSPISPILFLLFNTPLVKNCSLTTGYGRTEAFGWVDDVCILAVSNSYEENVWLIEKALERADQWAKRHAARFAPDKFELIHYSNPRAAIEPSPSPPSEYDVWAVPDDPCGHDQMPVAMPGRNAKYNPQNMLNTSVFGSTNT